jgi:hypothetical protein
MLRLANGRKVSCKAIGIYYSTTTGNTEAAAEWVLDLMVSGMARGGNRSPICMILYYNVRNHTTTLDSLAD